MTARLLLDDALNAYNRDELRLLWQLADRLADGIVLRACHERQPPSPVNVALDLRLTSQLTIRPGAEMAPTLSHLQTTLKQQAALVLAGLQDDPEYTACPRCGSHMALDYGKRRRPRWICETCHPVLRT